MELRSTFLVLLTLCTVTTVVSAGPVVTGSSSVGISYQTTSGAASFSGSRDFLGSIPGAPLGGNIRAMNSINDFGRRTALTNNPAFAHVLGPNETLISHAFFKMDAGTAFFPDLDFAGKDGASITINIGTMHFDQPVDVDFDTLMLHTKWNDQVSILSSPYVALDDHFTVTPSFRDVDTFLQAGMFSTFPVPNFSTDSPGIDLLFTGLGTDTLSLELTFSYDLLKNLEEFGQNAGDLAGLPSPQGFLEPFHFHIEYVVTPEPTSAALLLTGLIVGFRRRRRKRKRAALPAQYGQTGKDGDDDTFKRRQPVRDATKSQIQPSHRRVRCAADNPVRPRQATRPQRYDPRRPAAQLADRSRPSYPVRFQSHGSSPSNSPVDSRLGCTC